ncbi:MAG: SurA N-terminal domain-containing protein [Rhodospirillaceae bacterium]
MIQNMTVAIKESWLLKGFLGLVMISFAVWGVGDAINPAMDPNVVIKVDQVEVSAEELQRRFNQQLTQLREALGPDFTAKQAADLGILDTLIQQLSKSASLNMAARELGVTISDETLRKSIQEQSGFIDETGNFNRLLFNATLATNNLTEQGFIDLLRGDLLLETILQPVELSAGAPETMVDSLFLYRAEQRLADVLYIADSSIELKSEATEQELRKVYDENISSFSAPEYRHVTAAIVRPKDLVPPSSISQEEIQAYYDENIEQYRTRETRQVNQLIFGNEFEAQAAYAQAASGENLTRLAEKITLGVPIELGLLSANDNIGFDLSPIFQLALNSISTPIQTEFGWHLFEVTRVNVGSIKALPVVRDEIIALIIQERAYDEMYEATIYMEDQFAAGISVEEIASAPGFSYMQFNMVDRDGRDDTGAPLGFSVEQERFLRLAFSMERGIDSQLIETDEYAYILRVEDIIPSAPKPYERVANDVAILWEAQSQSTATAVKAKTLMNSIGPSVDLLAIAEENQDVEFVKLGPITRFGNSLRLDAIIPARYVSPEAMEKLFNSAIGDSIEARVTSGHIVARLIEVVPPDNITLAENRDIVTDAVKSSIASDLITSFTNSLTSGYNVTLNSEIIEQIIPQ